MEARKASCPQDGYQQLTHRRRNCTSVSVVLSVDLPIPRPSYNTSHCHNLTSPPHCLVSTALTHSLLLTLSPPPRPRPSSNTDNEELGHTQWDRPTAAVERAVRLKSMMQRSQHKSVSQLGKQFWYYVDGENVTQGPVTTTDMKQWYLKQIVTDETLVAVGGGEWMPLRDAGMFT